MNTKNILMVLSDVPYPLRESGLSLRYLPVIEYLSHRHTIDMIIIGDTAVAAEKAEPLRSYCRDLNVINDPKFASHSILEKMSTHFTALLPWTPPNLFLVHNGREITKQILEATKSRHYDSVVWATSTHTPYLFSMPWKALADRLVLDVIDSPSLYCSRKSPISLKHAPYHKYQSWKIMKWEAKMIRESTSSIYISSVDAQFVPEHMTSGHVRTVIPNGISMDTYTPSINGDFKHPNIGFLGNMGYPPNIEAVNWLYHHVFLPLRDLIPNLSFYIIGRDPDPSILSLADDPGVTVTGAVDDIWPYVNAVDIFVLPLWKGAGLKNKVLETMFAERPVVTSPIGNEGIGAVSGRDLFICETPEEFRQNVFRLLNSPAERLTLGRQGREFVAKNFFWDEILKKIESVIIGGGDAPNDAITQNPVFSS